jgi:uncharacterized protein
LSPYLLPQIKGEEMSHLPISGAGLGLRYELWNDLLTCSTETTPIKFLELAPENWMSMGGERQKVLDQLASRFPLVAHGLSLSLGGPSPLDFAFLADIRQFLADYHIELYTEHLSYCADTTGHWYDLLPVPMTLDTAHYVADRIKTVQDFLGKQIAIENASSYLIPDTSTLEEWEFVSTIAELANCNIHLDVNNVYVNSINHSFSAEHYIQQLDAGRVHYMHMAGHMEDTDPIDSSRLLIDTHGRPICEPVWRLFEHAALRFKEAPTLLERDFNVPPFHELEAEVQRIASIQEAARNQMDTLAYYPNKIIPLHRDSSYQPATGVRP